MRTIRIYLKWIAIKFQHRWISESKLLMMDNSLYHLHRVCQCLEVSVDLAKHVFAANVKEIVSKLFSDIMNMRTCVSSNDDQVWNKISDLGVYLAFMLSHALSCPSLILLPTRWFILKEYKSTNCTYSVFILTLFYCYVIDKQWIFLWKTWDFWINREILCNKSKYHSLKIGCSIK